MPNTNLRLYNIDYTGANPANTVVNERRVLNRQKNLPLAPINGAFYANSMVITNTETGKLLEKNIDYKFLEHFSSLREITGKPINGIVLIRDSDTNSRITMEYQCVGGEFATSSESLVTLLNTYTDNNVDYSWYNVLLAEKGDELEDTIPKGSRLTFESMCYYLEKVRNAILWSDSDHYQNTVNYVNRILEEITEQTTFLLEGFLETSFNEFIVSVNRSFLNLDVIPNLPLASIEDATLAMDYDTRITDYDRNKYIALDAIVSFKKKAHEYFISKDKTNIGKQRGTAIDPVRSSLFNMKNGGLGILLSKSDNLALGKTIDNDVYPPDALPVDSYSILKISNNVDNRGGIFIASSRSNGNMHFGIHLSGLDSVNFEWKKVIFDNDSDKLTNIVASHLLNENNPHNANRASVKLNLVENLEPIDLEEILCLQQCRKYVTFDAFLLFMKTFMVGTGAAADDPRNEYTGVDKQLIVYSKGKPVNLDSCSPPPIIIQPPPPPPPVFEIDKPTVSISNIQVGRVLDLVIAHVKGKIPIASITVVTGNLPAGITLSVNTNYPIFNSYQVKLVGAPTTAGIFNAVVKITSTTDDVINLPIELNIAEVDELNLEFTSTQTIIDAITLETLTVLLTGGPINSTIRLKAYSKYVGSLNDIEPTTIIEKNLILKTNSTGNASVSFPGGNPTGSIKLGDWENWVETTNLPVNVTSPIFIRTFI